MNTNTHMPLPDEIEGQAYKRRYRRVHGTNRQEITLRDRSVLQRAYIYMDEKIWGLLVAYSQNRGISQSKLIAHLIEKLHQETLDIKLAVKV